jgi:hypothetical protein
MRLRTRLCTGAVVVGALVAPLAPGSPAGAAPPAQLAPAVEWLLDQQEADGGFEVADFAGFETSDAVFALASAAQTGSDWDTGQALAAVEAATTGGETPKDPLDAIDDWVDSVQGGPSSAAAKAQQAAKVIALVVGPLGLDETDFDPSGDTEAAVDLAAALQAGAGSGGWGDLPLGGRSYVLWAHAALELTVPAALVASIAGAQHPDGGFDFSGSPDGEGFDVDITASIVLGLAASNAPDRADIIVPAVLGLQSLQSWTGEWAGPFDDGNPNSTALVVLMSRALGAGADDICWYGSVGPRLIGVPYPSPIRAITRRAQSDGRISSPSDAFGVNTIATSQSIQALAAVEGPAFYEGETCGLPLVSANERIAQAYYVDLLDRLTETGGAAYWAQQFQNGMSPALLAKRFVGTKEYGEVVTERMVAELLGREASSAELEDLGPLVRQGFRLHLRSGILGSDEYVDATEDDGAWAEAVYLDALGRPASAGDVEYVLDQLADGHTYGDIAHGLVFSNEGRRFFVRGVYHDLLRREPQGPDLTYWAGEMARGVSPERLVTLIIGSAEYRGLAANA